MGLAEASLGPRRGSGWAPPREDPLSTVPLSPGPLPRKHSAPPSPTPTTPRLLTTNRFLSSTSCRFRRISDFRTSILLSEWTLSRVFFLPLQLPRLRLFTQPAAANLLTRRQPKIPEDNNWQGGFRRKLRWARGGERERQGSYYWRSPWGSAPPGGPLRYRACSFHGDTNTGGKHEHEFSKGMLRLKKNKLYTYVNCT